MLDPGPTGLGVYASVIDKSGIWIVVVAVAVLFAGVGSVPFSATVTVSEIVEPDATLELACTTTVNVDEAPAARAPVAAQAIDPALPTVGSVPHVHPAGMVID